jgi:hypothetical protein
MSDTIKKMTGRLTSRGMRHWFDEHVSEDGLKRQEQEASIIHRRPALVLVSTDDKVPEVVTKEEVVELVEALLAVTNFIPQPSLVIALKEAMKEVAKRYVTL